MSIKDQFIEVGGQWAYIGQQKKSNGYGVIFLGGPSSFVSHNSSDWHEILNKKDLFDALLDEGYTIGYSNVHGASFGNNKALQDIKNLHEYMIKETKINSSVHLFAISMGGLLALRLLGSAEFIRAVVFSQPLLNVNKQREYIENNNLAEDDPISNAIASTHEVDYNTINKYIDITVNFEKLALASTPCKIGHGTGDVNVPVEINALVFTEIRIKNKLQIALEVGTGIGHDKEGACYSDHQGIIQFLHLNES